MKQAKDLFSTQAKLYSQYRPKYPKQLYDFIYQQVLHFENAWDCATGNGQVAFELASKFANVYASDLSEFQINNAVDAPNIVYMIERAEQSNYPDDIFDLITVAQAIHWFDFAAFFEEVKRVGRQNAPVAIWGYGLHSTIPEIQSVVEDFYAHTVGPYWDRERVHIENKYRDIEFPFEKVIEKEFSCSYQWTKENMLGYLRTWSSVQKYIRAKGEDPVNKLSEQLPDTLFPLQVTFPIFFKCGTIEKQ